MYVSIHARTVDYIANNCRYYLLLVMVETLSLIYTFHITLLADDFLAATCVDNTISNGVFIISDGAIANNQFSCSDTKAFKRS